MKGIEFKIEDVAKRNPKAKGARPEKFVNLALLKELDQSALSTSFTKSDLNAAPEQIARLIVGWWFSLRKISHGVYPEALRRVRDDNYLFSCHFEREREIFLDVKTHGGWNHY